MYEKTIAQLSAGLAAGEFSSEELTCAFLARIERFDPGLNAFITVTAKQALQDAKEAEAMVMAGGALCGLAGAYISTVYTPLWVEGMVAGRGWIALALTTFATWRPVRVLLGAYLFGGVTMLQFHLQASGVQVASQLLSMLPYVATIVVLVLISRNPTWIRANMPASLGKPFYPGN